MIWGEIMGADFDAELSFLFTAASITDNPRLRESFEDYYKKDKYRFYERARHSKHYNHRHMRGNRLESEVAMKRVFGILLCSDNDRNVREFVYKKLLNTDTRFRELVRKPKASAIAAFFSDMLEYKAKTYNAVNAPICYLSYLLYSKYGKDSDNETVNEYLSVVNKANERMSADSTETSETLSKNFRMEDIAIPRKVRTIIGKLKTGLDVCGVIDFLDGEILDMPAILLNPELNRYMEDYFDSGDEEYDDVLRSSVIAALASSAMELNGTSFNGSFGNVGITKDEQELIIKKIAELQSRLDDSGHYEFDGQINLAFYLSGFIFTLLAKEIANMKEFYFRNNSETQYVELQHLESVAAEKDAEIERLKAELVGAAEHGARREAEVERLTEEARKKDRDAIRPFVAEQSELNAKIRNLEKALEAEQAKAPELNALREFAFAVQSESTPPKTTVTLAELIQGKKLVIIGGHVNWRNKMKEQYPAIEFLDGKSTSLDTSIFSNADYILLKTSNMSHKLYYKVIDYLRERKIRFDYLGRSVNQELLEAEIVSVLQEKL